MDQERPWAVIENRDFTAVELQKVIFRDGKLVYDLPSLEAIRAYVKDQLENKTWTEERRFENPHKHYVNLSQKLYSVKMELLNAAEHGKTQN